MHEEDPLHSSQGDGPLREPAPVSRLDRSRALSFLPFHLSPPRAQPPCPPFTPAAESAQSDREESKWTDDRPGFPPPPTGAPFYFLSTVSRGTEAGLFYARG